MDVDDLAARLRARPELAGVSEADIERLAVPLGRTAIEMSQVCDGEARELARLRAASPGTLVLRVPLLDRDVASLSALVQVGGFLDGGV